MTKPPAPEPAPLPGNDPRVVPGEDGHEVWQVTADGEDRLLGVYEAESDAQAYAALVKGDD